MKKQTIDVEQVELAKQNWIEENNPKDDWERLCRRRMWDEWEYQIRMNERDNIYKKLCKKCKDKFKEIITNLT